MWEILRTFITSEQFNNKESLTEAAILAAVIESWLANNSDKLLKYLPLETLNVETPPAEALKTAVQQGMRTLALKMYELGRSTVSAAEAEAALGPFLRPEFAQLNIGDNQTSPDVATATRLRTLLHRDAAGEQSFTYSVFLDYYWAELMRAGKLTYPEMVQTGEGRYVQALRYYNDLIWEAVCKAPALKKRETTAEYEALTRYALGKDADITEIDKRLRTGDKLQVALWVKKFAEPLLRGGLLQAIRKDEKAAADEQEPRQTWAESGQIWRYAGEISRWLQAATEWAAHPAAKAAIEVAELIAMVEPPEQAVPEAEKALIENKDIFSSLLNNLGKKEEGDSPVFSGTDEMLEQLKKMLSTALRRAGKTETWVAPRREAEALAGAAIWLQNNPEADPGLRWLLAAALFDQCVLANPDRRYTYYSRHTVGDRKNFAFARAHEISELSLYAIHSRLTEAHKTLKGTDLRPLYTAWLAAMPKLTMLDISECDLPAELQESLKRSGLTLYTEAPKAKDFEDAKDSNRMLVVCTKRPLARTNLSRLLSPFAKVPAVNVAEPGSWREMLQQFLCQKPFPRRRFRLPALLTTMCYIPGGSFEMGDTFGEGGGNEKPVHTVRVESFYLAATCVTVAQFRAFVEDTGYHSKHPHPPGRVHEGKYQTDAERGDIEFNLRLAVANESWKEGDSIANQYRSQKDEEVQSYRKGAAIWVEGKGDVWQENTNWRMAPDGSEAADDHPVVFVSWNDAQAYCDWLNQTSWLPEALEGGISVPSRASGAEGTKRVGKYRLPTEAEWEYAARESGKKVRFGNGKDKARSEEMNFDARDYSDHKQDYSEVGEYRGTTVPVKTFAPNALGLHEMSGNAWEWCVDGYDATYYQNSPTFNPINSSQAESRVLRGGSWVYGSNVCRVAVRNWSFPSFRYGNFGFRLAR